MIRFVALYERDGVEHQRIIRAVDTETAWTLAGFILRRPGNTGLELFELDSNGEPIID